MWPWIWGIVAVAGVAVAMVVVVWATAWRRRHREASAKTEFRRRREYLEAQFLTIAGDSGRPRGLRWVDCDFDNAISYAHDPETGSLRAFVAVTISFEAIEGGGMEDVEAVGNLRAATAVFHWEGDKWKTDGRAVFNLGPKETIERFSHRPAASE